MYRIPKLKLKPIDCINWTGEKQRERNINFTFIMMSVDAVHCIALQHKHASAFTEWIFAQFQERKNKSEHKMNETIPTDADFYFTGNMIKLELKCSPLHFLQRKKAIVFFYRRHRRRRCRRHLYWCAFLSFFSSFGLWFSVVPILIVFL